jgi:hypothetical protein
LGQSGIKSQQLAALGESLLLGSVGEEAEVTDAHETVGQDMKQKAADKLLGIQSHRFFFDPRLSDLGSSRLLRRCRI